MRLVLLSSLWVMALQAAVVVRHTGAADPLTEGFHFATCCDPPATTAANLNDQGQAAWTMNAASIDTQTTYVTGGLTLQQLSDASNYGWKLTLTARAVNPGASFHATARIDTGTRRYDMGFGLDLSGQYTAYLVDRVYGAQNSSVRTLGLPDRGYHTLQLSFNPATQTADFRVDGVVKFNGYQGHTDFVANSGVAFGVLYGPGQGNFSLVQFETGPYTYITSITTASGGPDFAQNSWIEIKGVGLAPDELGTNGITWSTAPEFASGKMPTQLRGVSVKVNGKPAYVYWVSVKQVNVLTPLDGTLGTVQVQLTNGTVVTPTFAANLRPVQPTFLRFGGSIYIAAVHADGSYLGPPSISAPGNYFTPARPGETIVLFATGFGLPTATLVEGSAGQFGALPNLPVITFSGTAAKVEWAGVISPGLYQLNVIVPEGSADGDNIVTASYAGAASPAGTAITVKR